MGVTKQQLFNTVQRIKAYVDSVAMNGGNLNLDNVLTKDNIVEYTPTEDYHPATKQYVDNHSTKVSAEPNNSIEQKEDGLYVPSTTRANISAEENNALVEKKDGLYVPSVVETNISTEENNAVVKKDDGIFVEDKTDTIQAISDKIESINQYQKYVNADLGYYYIVHYDTTSPAQGSYLIPAEIISNMDYESNGVVTLKKDHKYLIQGSIRTSSGACGVALKDIDNNRCYFRAFSYPQNSSERWSEQAMNGIIVPEADMRCVFVFEEVYSGPIPSRLDFTITEIGRETIIDPVEHINNESGVEDTPVGHIISHMGTEAPAHYLICDGTEYNIFDYPYLAQHFKDSFGSVNYFGGDGITTFAVPDLRGEFLRGTGTATRNSGSGADVGKHQDATTFPNMMTYMNDNNTVGNITSYPPTGATEGSRNVDKRSEETGYMVYLESTSTSTGTESSCNYTARPTNTSVLYCIKYEPTYCISVKQTTEVSDKAFLSQVSEEYGIADSPVGHIMSHMGKTAPAHYLICDGAEYNIIDYPHLTKHFTNEFGSVNYFGGDGITTFAVPDLRGEFLRGSGTATRNSGSGANVGEHQNPTYHYRLQMSSSLKRVQTWNPTDWGANVAGADKIIRKSSSENLYVDGTSAGQGSGTNVDTMFTSRPTSTSVLYCIKYEPTYCINVNGYIQKETILWDDSLIVDCSYDTEKEAIDYAISLSDDIFNYDEIIIKYSGYITFSNTRTVPSIMQVKPKDICKFGSPDSSDLVLPLDMFFATFCLWGYFSNEKTLKMNLKNVQNTAKSAVDGIEIYQIIGLKSSYKNGENTDDNPTTNTELTDEEIEELVNKAYNEAIQEIEGVSS